LHESERFSDEARNDGFRALGEQRRRGGTVARRGGRGRRIAYVDCVVVAAAVAHHGCHDALRVQQ
jgi:adenylosuccinate synthase